MNDAQKSDSESSWFEYRRLILGELERLNKQMSEMNIKLDLQDGTRAREISDLRVEVGMLKVKAAMWGVAASSAVSVLANVAIMALRR